MAFALPMKRKQLHVALADDAKTFCVTADGFSGDLKWAEQRRKWLKETLDIKDWLEIEEVLDGESLKKPGRGRRLIAVHGDEFDSHDGQLKITGADEHLRRYVQAIRKFRDAGYSRYRRATDHGFFHWQPDDHEIVERLPTGEVLWKHRRAMVGHELVASKRSPYGAFRNPTWKWSSREAPMRSALTARLAFFTAAPRCRR